ncbi:SacI homology domain-containing protein [Gamsiella multidivaricata]|uniref:SacI homology domain-containing protein n=1 Tax=Gamsiella multidivaricata TaxID=101098 RepID=UPI002220DECC|nr:SacI homology domain-containing protein [Gamsiella multidivaricata]KAI7821076.1 SacI homology domain-containing protein [Gamsiella multidivaricata]
MLDPGEGPAAFNPDLTEFPAFTFPPPPTKPGQVILNRFVLYETKTRFFIVGTNAPAGTRFRVLKIDRTTAPDELSITEDEAVYTKSEVDDLLEMIANGNKSTGGMREIAKFYGIVGFVRFTEGYYLTIITKRSPVALIGGHYIFHIDATSTISIHSSTTPTSKLDKNSDEARYLQMFQMVDLTKNFYFSYSYDITRTLQWNMTRNHQIEGRNRMFVWNSYLLEGAFGEQTGIENQWALPIMYGFVDQSKLSILGRNVYVTLIARRSRFFAGARFLKRGVNDRGYVANDVETEQIVSEMSTTSFYGAGSLNANPNHTSFVQHRGSIPLYWTQDGTNMSPKPAIELNVVDPYFSAAALHFDDMFRRYGAPCIVLNLIKAKEKTPRESLLLKEFSECIEYLNQFLPEDKKIWHIKWDMSRASKSPNENVISVLEIIADKTFAQTGFFHSGFNQEAGARNKKTLIYGSGLQNGVVRTNCIDCLDRTNAAQFIIAKCALGHQLYSLGLIAEPVVPFDCDVVNMLTEMYHDHGDTIALQYGGSHLVNTMETYRKINQWTSHSRDMIESIRRFYSNSFVDAEKQDAMNLFLGNYRVRKGTGPALWELPGDYHLHNITDPELKKIRKSYIRWWTPDALLPQDALARKSFQEAQERDLAQFRLHDAGYDGYDGPFGSEFEGEYFDGDPEREQDQVQDNTEDLAREGSMADLKPSSRDGTRQDDHIENLRSEDEDDLSGNTIKAFGTDGRVDSMESMLSAQSYQSHPNQGTAITDADRRRSSLALSKISSVHSISSMQSGSQGFSQPDSGIRASRSNPNISSIQADGEMSESRSGCESSLDGSLLDFKERIVAPLNLHKDPSRSGTAPISSASSISSLRRCQQLRSSASRSSLAASSINGNGWSTRSAHLSRGERFVHDEFDACDDTGEDPTSAWEEYWDEYYRPKVQTSFQRLFAYNMNSTNRYIPPNIKKTSEQSPFEVRQNHSIPSQAELNAKAAAKSEKTSMLNWLGLTGNNSNKNNGNTNTNNKKQHNSKTSSGYANGSKTLPLSTGRKKGFLSSLDDDPAVQKKSSNKLKDGIAHHARGSRLSIASYPASGNAEFDEKAATASGSDSSFTTAALRAQQQPDGKVRLPAHVPRSKDEEWELTKNVWTNLPQFAIHDSTYTPGPEKKSPGTLEDKLVGTQEAAKDGSSTIIAASTEVGGKGRSHLEEMIKRSLQPDVTLHETKEYKRYTQQFKSIRFDSVPTKGAASYGINAISTGQKDELSIDTNALPSSGIVPSGFASMQQQQQQHGNKELGKPSTESSSNSLPKLVGGNQQQNGSSLTSTTTIGNMELNEEEEFYYAVSRAGASQGGKMQIMTSNGSMNPNSHMQLANRASPTLPLVVSPLLSRTDSTLSPAVAASRRQLEWGDGTRQDEAENEDEIDYSRYLPEPPILLAPVQTIIKPPSESEMVLYNAHVELPKLTLYTVGQTSLNPYWGASTGTRARYDAYMMWIMKGRYGNMTMPSAGGGSGGANGNSHGNGVTGSNSASAGGAVFAGRSTGAGTHPPLRRGSSAIYPTVGENDGLNLGGIKAAGTVAGVEAGTETGSPTNGAASKEQLLHQYQQQQIQHTLLQQQRKGLSGLSLGLA